MTALRAVKTAKPAPRTDYPHWLNRAWIYQPAASHGDTAAFRARMAAYRKQQEAK